MKKQALSPLFISMTLLSSSLALASEDANLKPIFQCQSQEFACDDSVRAIILKDEASGETFLDITRLWFGGVQKTTVSVEELANTGIPGVPRIFKGYGVRLSIQSNSSASESDLSATLSTQIDDRNTQEENLICRPY